MYLALDLFPEWGGWKYNRGQDLEDRQGWTKLGLKGWNQKERTERQ